LGAILRVDCVCRDEGNAKLTGRKAYGFHSDNAMDIGPVPIDSVLNNKEVVSQLHSVARRSGHSTIPSCKLEPKGIQHPKALSDTLLVEYYWV
jgi:hypothetical protein